MSKTNLKIVATDPSAKKISTSISDLNPNLLITDMMELAHKLNNLTLNNYDYAERIITTNLDLEPQPVDRPLSYSIYKWYPDRNKNDFYTNPNLPNPIEYGITPNETSSLSDIMFRIIKGSGALPFDPKNMPRWLDLTVSDCDVEGVTAAPACYSYYPLNAYNPALRDMWEVKISITKRVPCTVTGTLHFDATDQYNEFNKLVTWRIFDTAAEV